MSVVGWMALSSATICSSGSATDKECRAAVEPANVALIAAEMCDGAEAATVATTGAAASNAGSFARSKRGNRLIEQ